MLRLLWGIVPGFLFFSVLAQVPRPCHTSEMMQKWFEENPAYKAIYLLNQQQAKSQDSVAALKGYPQQKPFSGTYTVPVVFHILHLNGSENISDAQVLDAVSILNRDFQKLNPDTTAIDPSFKSLAANVDFEFALASIDPSGNCTNGIVRHYDSRTYWQSDPSDYIYTWPRSKYLNIYVVKTMSGGAAGYTYLPGSVPANMDAIVILSNFVGSIGTSNPYVSRALTHEVGHWFNLQHVWGMTNQPGVACGDDGVSDTPITKGFFGCPSTNPSVCNPPTIENIQNYLDYSYCSNMFTIGQATRMTNCLLASVAQRNNLSSASNLAATGTDFPISPCAPKADFLAVNFEGCIGSTFNFTDISYNGTVTAWQWNFTGGNPTVSTSQNPSAAFISAGQKSVTLKASNSLGADSVTKTLITVLPGPGSGTPGLVQSFETITFPDTNWISVAPPLGSGWAQISGAGATGSKCVFINNYYDTPNKAVNFYSPMFDLTGLNSPALSFKVAYSIKPGGNADKLTVFGSVDCAASWQVLYLKSDTTLHTCGLAKTAGTGPLTNPAPSEWRGEFVNLSMYPANSTLLLKFQFLPDSTNPGNNLFVDDINIGPTTNLHAFENEITSWNISPNPAQDLATITVDLSEKQNLRIELLDITGKTILNSSFQVENSSYKKTFDLRAFSEGLYFIRISGQNFQQTKKIIIH